MRTTMTKTLRLYTRLMVAANCIVVMGALSAGARAGLIDFEVLKHGSQIPVDQYNAVGAKIFDGLIGEVGQSGIDSAHSGTRVMVPIGAASIDGTTASSIAADHGVPPGGFGVGV